jgi:hypothetical protein
MALGGGQPRRSARGPTWRVRCPAHDDRTPSLDITETTGGRVLLVCRAGCSQCDVIDALRALGLWSTSSVQAMRRFGWLDHLDQPMSAVPPCCRDREHKCEHRREFRREYLIAHLLGNVGDAIAEIIARHPGIDATTLSEELHFAIGFGAIVPTGIEIEIANQIIDQVLREWTQRRAA